jgi:hypothetical protein
LIVCFSHKIICNSILIFLTILIILLLAKNSNIVDFDILLCKTISMKNPEIQIIEKLNDYINALTSENNSFNKIAFGGQVLNYKVSNDR